MANVEWRIEGPHFINCNCAYGCPCQFVALPTDGTCKAIVGFRIDKGNYGDVPLDQHLRMARRHPYGKRGDAVHYRRARQ